MKISLVEIRNFAILHNVDIDFRADKANVVFLNASNGGGKTTFQSALSWCIYGIKPEGNKFLSTFEFSNAKVGDIIKVSVKVILDPDQDGRISIIERAQNFEKVSDIDSKLIGTENLSVLQKDKTPNALAEPVVAPEVWLRKYFPPRLQGFFLFDGEQMTKFWEQNVKQDIERAVKEIARVDLFESIKKKMRSLEENKIRKMSKKGGGKAEELEQLRREEARLLEKDDSDYKKLDEQIIRVKEDFERLSRFIGESKGYEDDARELHSLEQEIQRLQNELNSVKLELDKTTVETGVVALLAGTFEGLKNQVEEAKREDWLPPPFEPDRIRILLNNNTCICGTTLPTGSNERKLLENLIEKYQVTSAAGKLLDETFTSVNFIKQSLESKTKLIDEKTARIKSLLSSQKSLRTKHQTLLDRLKGINTSDVSAIANNYQRTHDELVALEFSKKELGQSIQKKIKRIETLDKDIVDATKNDKEAQILAKEIQLCREIATAADQIYSNAIEQVRLRLERAVSDNFGRIKKGGFQTVITEDFEVLTLQNNMKVNLSEGEKMLKGYIFSIALRDVINLRLPLVVDTPFGRLGAAFRRLVAEQLASLMSSEADGNDMQMIFSMHDLEYTPLEREYFRKAQPVELYLANDAVHSTQISNLGEGIDPSWLLEGHWKEWANGTKS